MSSNILEKLHGMSTKTNNKTWALKIFRIKRKILSIKKYFSKWTTPVRRTATTSARRGTRRSPRRGLRRFRKWTKKLSSIFSGSKKDSRLKNLKMKKKKVRSFSGDIELDNFSLGALQTWTCFLLFRALSSLVNLAYAFSSNLLLTKALLVRLFFPWIGRNFVRVEVHPPPHA